MRKTEKESKIFNSVKRAVNYLNRLGWTLSEKSMYRHISQGWIQTKPWSQVDLDAYAEKFLKPREKSIKTNAGRVSSSRELREIQIEKAKVGVEYVRLRAEIMKEKYIERDVCTRLLAQRAQFYMNIMYNYSFELARFLQRMLEKDEVFFWDLQIQIEEHFRKHADQFAEMPFIDMMGDKV